MQKKTKDAREDWQDWQRGLKVPLPEERRQVGVRGQAQRQGSEWREKLPTFDGVRREAQCAWSSKDLWDFFMALFSQAIIENIVVKTLAL